MSANANTAMPLEFQTEQNRLNIFGFWIFLGAEIILFATLFGVYGVLAGRHAGGHTQQDLFIVKDVLIQTFLLLTSSFTMGISIYEMRRRNMKGMLVWFVLTLLLGAGFLFMEVREFSHYVHEGATLQTSAFLSSFFVLLGTHGLHVTIGIGWAILLIIQLARWGFTPITARKAFIFGLYWHFLDVVWIFIFTFVYLAGLVS